MAIQAHSAEYNRKAGVVGGVRHGSDMGVLVAGDLTSVAAAKAAIDTDVAKLHVAERLTGIRVKSSIDGIDDFLASGSSGSSIDNILALAPTVRGRLLRL